MLTNTARALSLILFLFLAPLSWSQDSLQNTFGQMSAVEFLPVEEAYTYQLDAQGDRLTIEWLIEPGYYLYRHRFFVKDHAGNDIPWDIEPGLKKTDEYFGDVEVYYQFTTLSIAISDLPIDRPSRLKISYQGCADAGLCYPPETFAAHWLPDQNQFALGELEAPMTSTAQATQPDTIGWFSAVLFALIGGMILNLMPCVFPILSLKALSLLQQHQRHPVHHGLAYSAGVVISFVAMAAVLIALRQAGTAVGWGFQLQSPVFVAALVYVFFLLALNLSGYFEWQASVGFGEKFTQGNGLGASFATGVLATVVASPCTAPFMGTALAFALTQPTAISLSIFASLGFGLALPFLAISAFPSLAARLPQPGQWMVSLKELLAFPLYATCVWLLWIISNQIGSNGMALVLLGLIAITFAIWIWRATGWRKYLALASFAMATAILFSPYLTLQEKDADDTVFNESLIDNELFAGRSVLVNITADWCITCLVNERNVLSDDEVLALFTSGKVTYIKGDWTRPDPVITAYLNKHQRDGVPLYVAYHKGQVNVLPQLLTVNTVLEAFE